VLIGMDKGVRIEQDYNAYGGKHTTALIPQDSERTVWHKTTFETFPRDVVYAAAHGNSPEGQLKVDKEKWPGGCMTGFVLWNSERLHEWKTETGFYLSGKVMSEKLYDEYDQWLVDWVSKQTA